jgi:hypothetical protein
MEQALKQTEETKQDLESIYPDYDAWLAAASWKLEDAAWLLVGLDPAMSGINNCALSEAAQDELRQYEMAFGKHLMLVDQYRVLIGDTMARRAEREWIIGADGDLKPTRFLQWCFDHHIGWHERLQCHLDETGQTFRYSDDSDMLRSIRRLAKQDSWLLWDAVLLTLGFNPDMTMTALIRRPNLQPGRDRFERDALMQACYLADTARGSWRAGKLDIVNDDEMRQDLSLFVLRDPREPQAEVFPKPFLLWAQDKGYAPPPQLLEELGLEPRSVNDNALSQSGYSTPYLQLMQKAIDVHRITDKHQPLKKELEAWFIEQTINGEAISANDASYMASFVRSPKSRKGGGRKY